MTCYIALNLLKKFNMDPKKIEVKVSKLAC
jgi:hypothetical protein